MEYASSGVSAEAINLIETFWPRMAAEIQSLTSVDLKSSDLPLARIKKIMKLDDEVKMISAEAPVLFAKAAELFIQEVTVRAWLHTEENKRRTLQKNDVALAISKYDQFDFLIDIVPREEIKPPSHKSKESHSPKSASNNNNASTVASEQSINLPLSNLDPQTASILNALNGGGQSGQTLVATSQGGNGSVGGGGGNLQYYFALPANGMQNGATVMTTGGSNGIPLQLQGLQTIQGLQGAQIILNQNGQPTIFSVANRE